MTIMGIDPGNTGAIAILDSESLIVEPMPRTPEGKLDLRELAGMMRHYSAGVTRAYLERVQARPGEGSVSTFTFGRGFGALEGMLAALSIPYVLVHPQVWSAQFPHGVEEKDLNKRKRLIKIARRGIVAKLFPGIDFKRTPRCHESDSGMVDATLIASYGFQDSNN